MERQKRPKVLPGDVERIETGCGKLYVLTTFHNDQLFEVFGWLGKAGSCAKVQTEGLTRAITLGLRCGIPPTEYIRQLKGIHCPSRGWDVGKEIISCVEGIALGMERALERRKENENNSKSACRAVKTKKP